VLIQSGPGKGILLTVKMEQHQRFAANDYNHHGSLTVVLHIHGRLVLEVLTNTREIYNRFDFEPGEQLLGSNAGKL